MMRLCVKGPLYRGTTRIGEAYFAGSAKSDQLVVGRIANVDRFRAQQSGGPAVPSAWISDDPNDEPFRMHLDGGRVLTLMIRNSSGDVFNARLVED